MHDIQSDYVVTVCGHADEGCPVSPGTTRAVHVGFGDPSRLMDRANFLPRELSTGQQQRAAVARALPNDPEVILAEEPAGNLDPISSFEILEILRELNEHEGRTVIMVTHNPQAAQQAERTLRLSAGRILSEE